MVNQKNRFLMIGTFLSLYLKLEGKLKCRTSGRWIRGRVGRRPNYSRVAAETKRGKAGEGGDTSELFGDSEAEGEPKASTRSFKQVRTIVAEISDFEPEEQPESKCAIPTRKSRRAKTAKSSKIPAEATPLLGRKKQKTSSKHLLSLFFPLRTNHFVLQDSWHLRSLPSFQLMNHLVEKFSRRQKIMEMSFLKSWRYGLSFLRIPSFFRN